MSDFVQKPGTGALFRNSKKVKESHPDRNGTLVLDEAAMDSLVKARAAGEPLQLDLSGWVKSGVNGQFISLSVKPAWKPDTQKAKAPVSPKGIKPVAALDDDEIPF